MSIDPQQIKSIFLKAVESCEPGHWDGFLDDACRDDPLLRSRVEELLGAHLGNDSLLQREDRDSAPTVDQPSLETAGTQIGPYKLLQQIGEGGMGAVYMAEQLEPVRRKVALKIIKPGMDTRQVIARFEAERQALSLMDHPHIARVLDAGATENGRPYFVMELVKGQPITKYCDEKLLSPRQRLELLLPVCHAIQHAHQKGIIHRDIKPSNILVAEYDHRAVPKVIDFGVAKAISQPLTEKTMFTGFGQIVGTLEYMSPEQAKVNQLDIDTRSDIYSLGVLLYELLTGTTPFDKDRLRSAAWDEMLRIIREEEPPKPSTRLSNSKASLPSVAAQRQTELAKLTKLVRGELDWIVMKALEKDRDRRYESANSLAADIERYLSDEPVLACPPSVAYRFHKFARKHQAPVLVGIVIVVLLLSGITGTTLGWVRARSAEQTARTEWRRAEGERDEKEEARRQAANSAAQAEQDRRRTRDALNSLTDDVVEQLLGRQVELTDRERAFLRKTQEFYEELAESQGNTSAARFGQADGLARVGKIQYGLGDAPQAELSFLRALESYRLLVDESPEPQYRLAQASCLGNLASAQMAQGELTEALPKFRESLEMLRRLGAEFPRDPQNCQKLANVQTNFGIALMRNGQCRAAEDVFQDSVTILRQLSAANPDVAENRRLLAGVLNNLATLLANTGQMGGAEPILREVIALERQLAEQFPDVPSHQDQLGKGYYNLGNVLATLGRNTDAEMEYRQAALVLKKLVVAYPAAPRYRQDLAATLSNLGNLLRAPVRSEEGERIHREAIAIYEKLIEDFGPAPDFRKGLAISQLNLGGLLGGLGKGHEAQKADRRAIDILTELVTEFPDEVEYAEHLATALRGLATLQLVGKQFESAQALLEQAQRLAQRVLDAHPENPHHRAAVHQNLMSLTKTLMAQRNHGAATALADQMVNFGYKPASDAFNAARLYAQCIDQVDEVAELNNSERRDLRERYAKRAIELLRQAILAGFRRVDLLDDSALDSIRDHSEFKKLVDELRGS